MKRIAVFLIVSVICTEIHANDKLIGIFNSPKGFGLSTAISYDEGLEMIDIYADMSGVYSGRSTPGFKISYTHAGFIKSFRSGNASIMLYSGPGVSIGRVRDFEAGVLGPETMPLIKNKGFSAAIHAKTGLIFDYGRKIRLNFGLRIEAGVHVRREEQHGNYGMSFYKNGLYESFLPELSILYSF